MARPATYDEALRLRLLDAAAQIVDTQGQAHMSLRDVARAAGTSTSAVYSLFGNKSALLLAVIEHGFSSFARSQEEVEPEGLEALGYAYRAWALENPPLYRLMFGGAMVLDDCVPDPEVMLTALTPLVRTLAARLPEDQQDEEAALAVAVAVWSQVHGAVSLELAKIIDTDIDWAAIYLAVVASIARQFPPR